MSITELISEDTIIPELRAKDRDGVLRELGAFLAARHTGVNEADAIRALAEREALGSTAVGYGIAIPHAKLPGLPALVACLGRSRRGVAFGAPDDAPTHLFVALLAPAGAAGAHLKALARISQVFRDESVREQVMAASDAPAMYQVLATVGPA